jgi:hypothetical protein
MQLPVGSSATALTAPTMPALARESAPSSTLEVIRVTDRTIRGIPAPGSSDIAQENGNVSCDSRNASPLGRFVSRVVTKKC